MAKSTRRATEPTRGPGNTHTSYQVHERKGQSGMCRELVFLMTGRNAILLVECMAVIAGQIKAARRARFPSR